LAAGAPAAGAAAAAADAALAATAAVSAIVSLCACAALYGEDRRDPASRWSIFPIIHVGAWLVSVLAFYPVALLLTSRVADPRQRFARTCAIATALATVATVACGALNPDRAFFSR
jgi:F0F1-type ATP synthase membrane subunit c/vacuolar-type H+-ATPase subunit K